MPMIAFMGVRISWLMVARKALLASFAASAARRAACASSKSRAFSMAELSREAICCRLVSSWAE